MNKIQKILLAVIGGCSIVMEILTPIAIALFWGFFFDLSEMASILILIIGGLGTMFRAIKIGWLD